jgi:hypothetical protein
MAHPPHAAKPSNVNYPGGAEAYGPGGISITSMTSEQAPDSFSGPVAD